MARYADGREVVEMDLTASFSVSAEDLMPDLIIADYTQVESWHRAAIELGLEPGDEHDSTGWMVIGRVHSILHHNDDQFSDIEEDDEGYKRFLGGLDDSLKGAYAMVMDNFDGETAGYVKHKINGSTQDFELALEKES